MSLYNMLFGKNPASDFILSWIGTAQDDFYRFRDAYVREKDGQLQIVVHTRNGGGNRECWNDGEDECQGCTGCFMQNDVMNMPHYLYDEDDDFDFTYADIVFAVPSQFETVARVMTSDDPPPAERWQELFTKLRADNPDDPQVKRALEVGKPIIDAIAEKLAPITPSEQVSE